MEPSNGHRHKTTNACHRDHAKCDATKNTRERGSVYGHIGGDHHGPVSVLGCNEKPCVGAYGEHYHVRQTSPFGSYCHAWHLICDNTKYDDETGTVYGHTGGDNHGVFAAPGCILRQNCPTGQHRHIDSHSDRWKDLYPQTRVCHDIRARSTVCRSGGSMCRDLEIFITDTADAVSDVVVFVACGEGGEDLAGQGVEILIEHEIEKIEEGKKKSFFSQVWGLTEDGARTTAKFGRRLVTTAGGLLAEVGVVLTCHFTGNSDSLSASDSQSDSQSDSKLVKTVVIDAKEFLDALQDMEEKECKTTPETQACKDLRYYLSAPPFEASGLSLAAGDGEIAVSWTASTTTPEAGFGYRVQWKLTSQTWDQAAAAAQAEDLEHGSDLATSHTVTGLVNGSAYDVRVAAFNADGVSAWITAAATPVAPAYKAPAGLVSDVRGYAAETHHGQDHVDRWNGALEGLCVEDFPGVSAMTSAQAQGHADAYSSSRWSPVVAELKKAEAANCTIAAKPEPKATAPDPASGLSLSAGDKQIAVSWSASATTPAAGFGYRVQWKLVAQAWGDAAVGSVDLDHGSDLATSHTVTGLVNGSAYDVRVAAFNAHGVSAWVTGQATPAAAVSAPDPASGLSLSAGDKQIAVSWSASATTPAAGFGYRVQWKLVTQAWGDAAAGSVDLDHGSDLATSHTVTGLANGSAYDVRVAAFNADGVSDWVTGQTTPTAPKPEAKPSLAFESVSCESSGSGWVITATWSKTPETLKPDIWANEAKNRGHRSRQTAVAGTSTTFDVPNAGWYQVGMQAKIAGNKKVGDNKAVRCR